LEYGKGIIVSEDIKTTNDPLKEFVTVPSVDHPSSSVGPKGFFADQFEVRDDKFLNHTLAYNSKNESNFESHYHGTGPEIWKQTGGRLDAFVSGAGTSPRGYMLSYISSISDSTFCLQELVAL
jgi:hypothetical protein